MTIKRALFALIAMMILPGMAAAQDFPATPPVTPAEGTAVIAVLSAFADGNAEDSIEVDITCSSGTISPADASLGNGEGQSFVLSNIPEGVTTTCTVTSGGADAYGSAYLCFPGSGGAPDQGDPDADESCSNPDFPAQSCFFEDVRPYEGNGVEPENVGYCAVLHAPIPVDVEVVKIWEMAGAAQSDIDTDVKITLYCDAEIVGGTRLERNLWRKSKKITEYLDEDGLYDGIGATTFKVIPEWYRTRPNPDNQEYTECWADENVKDSAVEVDNDCGNIQLAAGMGDSCTITNTVFFEGIPTLSQYGMAIMALLMLGVGFVGMRRFV